MGLQPGIIVFGFIVVVSAITISPNGNSPEIKMIGGMMVDVQKSFVPVTNKIDDIKENNTKKRKINANSTSLSINERYRRLIPYMTFYYANDHTNVNDDNSKNLEFEKAQILETPVPERTAKKLAYTSLNNIPRYQGNRLTQHNIASSNPNKIFKDYSYHVPVKVTQNYNSFIKENYFTGYNGGRLISKPINAKAVDNINYKHVPSKPQMNVYRGEDYNNIKYYVPEKENTQRYKLVPYEQTAPVKVIEENSFSYESYNKPTAVPVLVPQEQYYYKARPNRPHYVLENAYVQQSRKQPARISENYYDRMPNHVQDMKFQPIIEGGFKPIIDDPIVNSKTPLYHSSSTERIPIQYHTEEVINNVEAEGAEITNTQLRPTYYQYIIDQPYKSDVYASNDLTLNDLIRSLNKNKSPTKPPTRENIDSSIRTLMQILTTLKVMPQENEVEVPMLSTPKPFVATKDIDEIPENKGETLPPQDVEFGHEPYLTPVSPPSQHIDEYPGSGSTSQKFPLPVNSEDDGGTPGKAGVDYPTLTSIPPTSFDCKTQRYKGFFADPETRCQVWHYCDLNGGQASFLCPNGTIFSQAGLTCDWWFNVRCASTTQLYVLNESLYKYILPHSPKFPEDYSGPLVDKYLTLKFKEMEEQFKKNKRKQASEKTDSDDEDSSDTSNENENNADSNESATNDIKNVNIVVDNPGTSGNVERLHD